MRQPSLQANSKFHCRQRWPHNRKLPARSKNIKIRTSTENDGGWAVELPKGRAARFIEHCKNSGIGFALITGVYSGLYFAARDRVLFDGEFDLEQLQKLVKTFDRAEAGQRIVKNSLPAMRNATGNLNQIKPTNSNEHCTG